MNLIEQVEKDELKRLGKNVPEFDPGDTVIVNVSVVEGERKRVQAYEGVVIAKRNRGINSSFTVRKISSGEGVERTFQTYSPLIASGVTNSAAMTRSPSFSRCSSSTSTTIRPAFSSAMISGMECRPMARWKFYASGSPAAYSSPPPCCSCPATFSRMRAPLPERPRM